MSKKALLGLILTSLTSMAYANGATVVPAHHNAFFYGGIGVSRDEGHYTNRLTNRFLETNTEVVGSNSTFHWSSDGVGGHIFAGAGLGFTSHLSLALEAFGSIHDNEGKFTKTVDLTGFGVPQGINTSTFNGRIQQNWTAGISLLPAIKIEENTDIFIRFGGVISEFKVDYNPNGVPILVIDDIAQQVFPWPKTAINNFSQTRAIRGLQAGLGLQSKVWQNLGLRGEWDITRYSDFKADRIKSATINTSQGPTAFTNITNFRIKTPYMDQFKFSLFYQFNMA